MFKGQYKFIGPTGFPITYAKNDVVVYQGKLYQASNSTQKNPLEAPDNWTFIKATEPIASSLPPVLPKENQFWVDSTNTLYVWSSTDNIYSWKQISGGTGGGGSVTSVNGLTGAVQYITDFKRGWFML